MLRLDCPERDAASDYDRAATRRAAATKVLLDQCRAAVIDAYLDYSTHASSQAPRAPVPFGPDDCRALRGNFRLLNLHEELEDLRADVMRASAVVHGRCPMCAVGRVSAIDHYLPRTIYPEFTILVENLVPSCERCNRIKGRLCVTSGDRPFFHPYFDTPPAERLLIAEIAVTTAVAVRYKVADVATDGWGLSKLKHHFELFDLGSHYQQEAIVELGNTAEAFQRIYSSGGADALRDYLLFERNRRAAERGMNQWDVALYEALADEPAFFDAGFEYLLP